MKVSYETFLKVLFRQSNSLTLNVYYTTSLSVTHGRYIMYEVSVRLEENDNPSLVSFLPSILLTNSASGK